MFKTSWLAFKLPLSSVLEAGSFWFKMKSSIFSNLSCEITTLHKLSCVLIGCSTDRKLPSKGHQFAVRIFFLIIVDEISAIKCNSWEARMISLFKILYQFFLYLTVNDIRLHSNDVVLTSYRFI